MIKISDTKIRVKIPKIASIPTALKIYYENNFEIGNKQIQELFGLSANAGARVCKLKELARVQMVEDGLKSWNTYAVRTESAYKAWNIDIEFLEKNFAKLEKMRLLGT